MPQIFPPGTSLDERVLLAAGASPVLMVVAGGLASVYDWPPPIPLLTGGIVFFGPGLVALLVAGLSPVRFAACAAGAVAGASVAFAFVSLAAKGWSYHLEWFGEVYVLVAVMVLAVIWSVTCLAMLLAIFIANGLRSAD